MVNVAALVVTPVVAKNVTSTDPTGSVVVILKVAGVDLGATRIIGGTFTNGLLLLRKTMVPPKGAALDRVTVPTDVLLPATPARKFGRFTLSPTGGGCFTI